jgi:hypothetical protein
MVRSHIEVGGLLNASKLGFRAHHSTPLQCMRLTDHISFNNNLSTAAVFLNIEKAFDATWYLGLVYKLRKLKFSTNLIKLLSLFLSARRLSVSVESEMFTLREIQGRVPQGSVLSSTLYSMYINYTPQTLAVYLADGICVYATDRKEGYILRELQRGLNSTETWCKRWNTKFN